MAQVRDMTQGRPSALILRFAVPLMLGNLLQQAYSLIDATIVGRALGIGPLASVGASSSVLFLILGFCNGCCGGFGIPIAQSFGAHDYGLMRRYVRVSLLLSTWFSLIIALITSLLCRHILLWMQTPSDILHDAWVYLFITFLGIPATFAYNLLSSIIRALGDSRTPFFFLLLSTLLNILLDLVLILWIGWGVAGAAVATLVSQLVSALLCYHYMQRSFPVLRYQNAEERRFSSRLALHVLGIGVPMGLQFSITAVGSMVMQAANNALGTACVAAFTAAMRLKMFFICMLENLGVAMATYCGQNYGAGERRRILLGIRDALLIAFGYSALVLAFLWPMARPLGSVFVESGGDNVQEVLTNIELFLHCSIPFYPVLGTLCVLRYSIQGMGHTRLSMFSGVSEMFARVGVSLLAVPVWGYAAVCFCDPTAWIAAVCFLVPAFIWAIRTMKLSASNIKKS